MRCQITPSIIESTILRINRKALVSDLPGSLRFLAIDESFAAVYQ